MNTFVLTWPPKTLREPRIRDFIIAFFQGLFWLYFIFLPLAFLINTAFNVFSCTNWFVIYLLALLTSIPLFRSQWTDHAKDLPIGPSILTIGITLLVLAIHLFVGIDFSTDTFYYHLNAAIPIALQHNLLEFGLFNLNSFSEGYPKYAEFAQAAGIELTGSFWGYGLTTIFVIPASYLVSFLIALQLGFKREHSGIIGLTYALNPINVAQAAHGLIDSFHSLYVLGAVLFLLQATRLRDLMIFALCIASLISIKFTGVTQGALLLFLMTLWKGKKFIMEIPIKYLTLPIIAVAIGCVHYGYSFWKLGTFFFPFIDTTVARNAANFYAKGEGLWQKLGILFFSPADSASLIYEVAAYPGAFSPVWYPMPFLIVLAFLISLAGRDWRYSLTVSLFGLLLLLDPVTEVGRYLAFFQWIGFASFVYVGRHLERHGSILWIMPAAYAGLTLFILANPKGGTIAARLDFYHKHEVLIDAAKSQRAHGLTYFYHVNSPCSGFYWYMKYHGLAPKLVSEKPAAENAMYVYAPTGEACREELLYTLKADLTLTKKEGEVFFSPWVQSPYALQDCVVCLSGHNCVYVPSNAYGDLTNLTRIMPPLKPEDVLGMSCRGIDGRETRVERRIPFDVLPEL